MTTKMNMTPVQCIKAEDMHMSWFVKSRDADDQPINTINCIRGKRSAKCMRTSKIGVDAKSGLKMRMVEQWTSPTLGNSGPNASKWQLGEPYGGPKMPVRPVVRRKHKGHKAPREPTKTDHSQSKQAKVLHCPSVRRAQPLRPSCRRPAGTDCRRSPGWRLNAGVAP